MNRSVLRQETSRTACVSNHPGGRSSVGSYVTGFTNILFFTLGACNKVDNIGRLQLVLRLSLMIASTMTSWSVWELSFCKFCISVCRTVVSPQGAILVTIAVSWMEDNVFRWNQSCCISPDARHWLLRVPKCTCIRQLFHGTVVNVSSKPETMFMVTVHWRYWNKGLHGRETLTTFLDDVNNFH